MPNSTQSGIQSVASLSTYSLGTPNELMHNQENSARSPAQDQPISCRRSLQADTPDHPCQIGTKKQLEETSAPFPVVDIADQEIFTTACRQIGHSFLATQRWAIEVLQPPQSSTVCVMQSDGRDPSWPDFEGSSSRKRGPGLHVDSRCDSQCLHQLISVHSHPYRARGLNHGPPPMLISDASISLTIRCSASAQPPSYSVP